MKIVFYIKYTTRFGEQLKIRGNAAALGSGEVPVGMQYFNEDYWKLETIINLEALPDNTLAYDYILEDIDGTCIDEFHQLRKLTLAEIDAGSVKVYDTWNYAGDVPNVFYTAPFQQVLLQNPAAERIGIGKTVTHIFKIKAPLLKKDEAVCLLGEGARLGNWDIAHAIPLKFDGIYWAGALDLAEAAFPFAYKYGIYNSREQGFVRYEEGGNRICFEKALAGERIILQDGFMKLPDIHWRGAGIAIPVFSLRSESGLGVGEFNDLRLLADWAVTTGLQLIQLLPVNDTIATNTWSDSYPYAAISAFALHPIYIHLEAITGKKRAPLNEAIRQKRIALNELAHVDYEAVLQFKMDVLRDLFEENGADCEKTEGYKHFFAQNAYWLKPYAVFSYLRDTYHTPDPAGWDDNSVYNRTAIERFFNDSGGIAKEVGFYCYVQYQLHIQLSEAVAYAREKGIIMKGDIPIGVYRYGCDAWTAPDLYNMPMQAGAPPDDFAVKGQNWGFPTYNWQRMQDDGFAWWAARFEQMSRYFDAFRIDHILGFFRIWSIPLHAVQGIMGQFDPCIPVQLSEFGEQGVWFNYERFCLPYITDEVLQEIFDSNSGEVKATFLQRHGPQQYVLLPQFDTQQKVSAYFTDADDSKSVLLRDGLYDLISNVILFEQAGSDKQAFHFRIAIDQTSSFRHLQPHIREKLWYLYIDYFYHRQNDFWRRESLKKLPQLKAATNMLICGEDLGMVPETVPGVMKQLGILSLEIQRMPKQAGIEFFNPARAPYLSVVTPSTHDMSTIRGWWQEDKEVIQRFYNDELGQTGAAPEYCEPWINRAIVLQHLYSPAMWSIFQIQDLLGMNAALRRKNPDDERINIPANPRHYWRYRMHLGLEQLLREENFNNELREYVEKSGRNSPNRFAAKDC